LRGSNALVLAAPVGKNITAATPRSLIVAEPLTSSIRSLSAQPTAAISTITNFTQLNLRPAVPTVKHPADDAPGTIRPTGLAVGPDMFAPALKLQADEQVLYMTDFNMSDAWSGSKAKVLRVPLSGNGTPTVVAEIPVAELPGGKARMEELGRVAGISSAKAASCSASVRGVLAPATIEELRRDQKPNVPDGVLLVATFTIPSLQLTAEKPAGRDSIYAITPTGTGSKVTLFAKGLDGIMFMKIAPGEEVYGPGVYVPTLGTPSVDRNGGVFVVRPGDTTPVPFLKNVKAASVAFDIQGILGVKNALYVASFDPYQPGEIWRITPLP
jgi:hypothetical protein